MNVCGKVFIIITQLALVSCVPNKSGSSRTGASGVSNNSSTVNVGYGRILASNPIILSGNSSFEASTSLSTLLSSSKQDYITSNSFLTESCSIDGTTITSCFQVKQDSLTNQFQSIDGKWGYEAGTSEFLQVHTFAHIKKQVSQYLTHLNSAKSNHVDFGYNSAIPSNLASTNAFWHPSDVLTTFSQTDLVNNAFFDPTSFITNFGFINHESRNIAVSEDPSVIYHELGHAITNILLNTRNVANALTVRATNKYTVYDESGAIDEGLADYLSYYVTGRAHFGEWAFGRYFNGSRAMSEDDNVHAAGVSTDADSRLSYPDFVSYNSSKPTVAVEDSHNAGQIISHYLVALTKDLMSTCSFSQSTANYYVFSTLAETLSELGSLTGLGNSTATHTINLDANSSQVFLSKIKPVTFRSFSQTFAKYLTFTVGNSSKKICNSTNYSKDKIETLLDNYGLLLFNSYNEDGNNETNGHLAFTNVTASNRLKTNLISKDLLIIDPTDDAFTAGVTDSRQTMQDALDAFTGTMQLSDQIYTDLRFNNNNGKLSPGELVAVTLNLYNNSNSTMGGVRILANDWDHFDTTGPCNNLGDDFPTATEGGKSSVSCSTITKDNGFQAAADKAATPPVAVTTETVDPICFVQIRDEEAAVWKSQEALREEIALSPASCLSGAGKTSDCFLRAQNAADVATYSKIDPKKTWKQTYQDPETLKTGVKYNNTIFFEVHPSTPPGTVFNCRFRATFSNCSDCFESTVNSNDDLLDYKFSGAEPFKIINYQFKVID